MMRSVLEFLIDTISGRTQSPPREVGPSKSADRRVAGEKTCEARAVVNHWTTPACSNGSVAREGLPLAAGCLTSCSATVKQPHHNGCL